MDSGQIDGPLTCQPGHRFRLGEVRDCQWENRIFEQMDDTACIKLFATLDIFATTEPGY